MGNLASEVESRLGACHICGKIKVLTNGKCRECAVMKKVRVKTWDELCEVGTTRPSFNGNHIVPPGKIGEAFTQGMKHLCGKIVEATLTGDDKFVTDGYTLEPWMCDYIEISTPCGTGATDDTTSVQEELSRDAEMKHKTLECNLRAAILCQERAEENVRPFMLLKPQVFKDGNEWCALYGENIQDGVAGFGDTPDEASRAFDAAWKG
jgi:hypothetical protein